MNLFQPHDLAPKKGTSPTHSQKPGKHARLTTHGRIQKNQMACHYGRGRDPAFGIYGQATAKQPRGAHFQIKTPTVRIFL
jgi:hypothetical protein